MTQHWLTGGTGALEALPAPAPGHLPPQEVRKPSSPFCLYVCTLRDCCSEMSAQMSSGPCGMAHIPMVCRKQAEG